MTAADVVALRFGIRINSPTAPVIRTATGRRALRRHRPGPSRRLRRGHPDDAGSAAAIRSGSRSAVDHGRPPVPPQARGSRRTTLCCSRSRSCRSSRARPRPSDAADPADDAAAADAAAAGGPAGPAGGPAGALRPCSAAGRRAASSPPSRFRRKPKRRFFDGAAAAAAAMAATATAASSRRPTPRPRPRPGRRPTSARARS